jgi:hypothetical protein
MDLYLRKVTHQQAHDNYRVILKHDDGTEIEIGSIGVQHTRWLWGYRYRDPHAGDRSTGRGRDRKDRMQQFKAAWERFAADAVNLTEFLNAKRRRRLGLQPSTSEK